MNPRWMRWGAVLAGAGASVALAGTVPAAATGNNNSGDAWVDNVDQPPGPGHEMDPHLACADINLWGAGMADPSGTFTIDGWPPSGSQEQDFPASGTAAWTYNQAAGGSQIMAVIPVKTLTANAIANGDAPQNGQPTTAPSGAVEGLSTGPVGGVAGVAVSTPRTGVELPVLPALALILTGSMLALLSRRLRRSG
ncbi:MAG: hypothetical protein E6J20_19815 [Chloroflexi bacterium]|nr:MAG: hypothetical protein E6J20_19815 [Chloroflexota bacterium]